MENKNYHELASNYILKSLTKDEKEMFFNLAICSSEFRDILKEEYDFYNHIKSFKKYHISSDEKQCILDKIKLRQGEIGYSEKAVYQYFTDLILKLTLPKKLFYILNYK